MAFRFVDPKTQYRKDDGTLCAGGTLNFFVTGTSTPKDVYGEPDLTPNNGAVIDLDSAGRPEVDIWLDGSYRVILKDSAAVQIWSLDDVREFTIEGGITVLDAADGTDGQVYLTDGAAPYWGDLLAVPDPTGHSGKVLGNDGTDLAWQAVATAVTVPTGGVVETTAGSNIIVGSTRIICGSGTIASGAGISGSAAITFPASSFASAPVVVCTATTNSVTNNSPADDASISAISKTASGFTARAFCGAENNAGTIAITSSITFDYVAMGTKAA